MLDIIVIIFLISINGVMGNGESIITISIWQQTIFGKNVKWSEDPTMIQGDGKHLCFKPEKIVGGFKLNSNLIACDLAM